MAFSLGMLAAMGHVIFAAQEEFARDHARAVELVSALRELPDVFTFDQMMSQPRIREILSLDRGAHRALLEGVGSSRHWTVRATCAWLLTQCSLSAEKLADVAVHIRAERNEMVRVFMLRALAFSDEGSYFSNLREREYASINRSSLGYKLAMRLSTPWTLELDERLWAERVDRLVPLLSPAPKRHHSVDGSEELDATQLIGISDEGHAFQVLAMATGEKAIGTLRKLAEEYQLNGRNQGYAENALRVAGGIIHGLRTHPDKDALYASLRESDVAALLLEVAKGAVQEASPIQITYLRQFLHALGQAGYHPAIEYLEQLRDNPPTPAAHKAQQMFERANEMMKELEEEEQLNDPSGMGHSDHYSKYVWVDDWAEDEEAPAPTKKAPLVDVEAPEPQVLNSGQPSDLQSDSHGSPPVGNTDSAMWIRPTLAGVMFLVIGILLVRQFKR